MRQFDSEKHAHRRPIQCQPVRQYINRNAGAKNAIVACLSIRLVALDSRGHQRFFSCSERNLWNVGIRQQRGSSRKKRLCCCWFKDNFQSARRIPQTTNRIIWQFWLRIFSGGLSRILLNANNAAFISGIFRQIAGAAISNIFPTNVSNILPSPRSRFWRFLKAFLSGSSNAQNAGGDNDDFRRRPRCFAQTLPLKLIPESLGPRDSSFQQSTSKKPV